MRMADDPRVEVLLEAAVVAVWAVLAVDSARAALVVAGAAHEACSAEAAAAESTA